MIGAVVIVKEQNRPLGYVVQEDGCWEWTGAIKGNGYGNVWSASTGRVMPAHRFVYELERGPIPEGLDLDHLCRNRRCVRPDHLEPVTRSVNIRRGAQCSGPSCKHGHVRSPENTSLAKNGSRSCLVCRRIRDRQRYPARFANRPVKRRNGHYKIKGRLTAFPTVESL